MYQGKMVAGYGKDRLILNIDTYYKPIIPTYNGLSNYEVEFKNIPNSILSQVSNVQTEVIKTKPIFGMLKW